NDRHQVGVAAALADAVDRALNLIGTFGDGGQRVGHADSAIVMAMDTNLDLERLAGLLDGGGDFLGKRAAVGVAEDDGRRPSVLRGAQRLQSIVGIFPEAVEEMLCIVENFAADCLAVGYRVGNHLQILFEGRSEDLLDMQVPGLADEGNYRRL